MSSANYSIQLDELSAGGGQSSSSTYQVRDSAGSSAGASASSSSYVASVGFRSAVYDRVVDYSPYIEDRSSQVAISSLAGLTATVSTTSGLSVGDYVFIVQDEGVSQQGIMAKITGISSPNFTIDSSYSGVLPTIDGVNDYVYRMSSSASISLGTLSSSSVTTHVIGWVATSDVNDGYSIYLYSDGDLRDGAKTISGVSDGSVTAGSSEYGGRASPGLLANSTFDTQDTAFTTTPQQVANLSSHPFQTSSFLTIKAAVSSSQAGGTYGQTLVSVFVGEY